MESVESVAEASAQSLSILQLILDATWPVQLIMLILLALSCISWMHMVNKWRELQSARARLQAFEREFWSGVDLNGVYQRLSNNQDAAGLEKIFVAGFGEFLRLRRQANAHASDIVDGTRRAMKACAQREIDAMETHIPMLATIGSISPYIGLLGTVWGIMHAFLGLGAVGTATLATVAPGIAEALIATAIGLFAAIPAVVGYNRFSQEVDQISLRFESFMEEFSNILQRQALRSF